MIQVLLNIGLTKNEAKVYFAFLELGEASILQVAKKTHLHRSVVHVVTEKLIQEGFLIESKKGVKRIISARSPDHLREKLRREQRELRKKELKFEEILPELRQIYRNESPEYRVTILDGTKGMETWCEIILDTAYTEMLEVVRIEEFVQKTTKYLQNVYFPRKAEIGLPTRFLFADTPFAREYIQTTYIRQKNSAPMLCKFIPNDPKIMHGFKVVWNQSIGFYSSREEKCTLVNDENFANHERALFEIIWKNSGKFFTNRPEEGWQKVVTDFEKRRAHLRP